MTSVTVNDTEFRIYNTTFAVSREGAVLKHYKPVTPTINSGYYLCPPVKVHRMVAVCWVPNPCAYTQIHHLDKNKLNNSADNLIWVTVQQHNSEFHAPSLETKAKQRAAKLGTHLTESTKDKLRVASTGKVHSEETKTLISRNRTGMVFSPLHIQHIQETRVRVACVVDEVSYDSFKSAADSIELSASIIRRRCLSPNFPSYCLLDAAGAPIVVPKKTTRRKSFGVPKSPRHIQNMIDSRPNRVSCTALGVVYDSYRAAAKATGLAEHTLRKRCVSENFPDFFI